MGYVTLSGSTDTYDLLEYRSMAPQFCSRLLGGAGEQCSAQWARGSHGCGEQAQGHLTGETGGEREREREERETGTEREERARERERERETGRESGRETGRERGRERQRGREWKDRRGETFRCHWPGDRKSVV